MFQRFNSFKFFLSFAVTVSLGFTSAALAQSPKDQATTTERQQRSEMHKKMAEMHSKMAACLVSDKALSQCRQEMLDACSTNFGDNCPMMGKRKMRGGRGMGTMGNGSCMDWMMNPSPAVRSTTTPKK